MPLVREREAATMPQHVGMNCERYSGALAETLDKGMKALGRHRRAALRHKHMRAGRLLTL